MLQAVIGKLFRGGVAPSEHLTWKGRRRLRAITTVVTVACATVVSFAGALPAWAETVGDFNVDGGDQGADYSYSNGVLTIDTSTPLTISTNGQTSGRIAIAENVSARITLRGVNIFAPTGQPAIDVSRGSSLAVKLADGFTNKLRGGSGTDSAGGARMAGGAGIHLPHGASLTIQCSSVGGGHQCNGACGGLVVTGGMADVSGGVGGTGIGGAASFENAEDCGTVAISGGLVTVEGGYGRNAAGAGIGGGAGIGNGGNGGEVYISGGVVHIDGGDDGEDPFPGAGIGGGCGGQSNGGDGGTVVILVPATVAGGKGRGDSKGADIGGGRGKVSGGSDGSGIQPGDNGTYEVYGNLILPDGITISSGVTVTVPSGQLLTVPEGTTLTVDGTLEVAKGGSLVNNGTITGGGTLTGGGSVTNNGTISVRNNDFAVTVGVSVISNGDAVASVSYGSTVTLTAVVTNSRGESVTNGTVDFYRGEVGDANKLNDSAISLGSDGTAALQNYQITGENWTPGMRAYAITAVYTPASGSNLLSGSDDATLTVSKGTHAAPPDAPIIATATTNSVTLTAVSGENIEYGYTTGTGGQPGNWQTETTFNNLSAGTDYTFYTRYAETDYYEASDPSTTGLTVTTLPQITTTSLDAGYVGVKYQETLEASAASGKTVTWALASDSILPDGLTLNENGTITGTPEGTAANHNFIVQATIQGGASGSENLHDLAGLSITINAGTPDITANTYKGDDKTNTFTYGDTITVSGTIAASATAPGTSTNSITQNQVGLYLGETELATANVENDGSFALTYDTSNKGITPSETAQTLTVKYGGSSDLNDGETTVSITLNKATPDALPDGPNILQEKTTTSVTLHPVDNDGADIYGTIQYGYKTGDEASIPEDRWQNSNAFSNLSPGTDYNFFTRYAGNEYYNSSNLSYFGYLIITLPSITTTSLTSGYVGVEYEAQLEASVADNKTVTWTLGDWATLPDGLTLDAETGMISGVPKETVTSHSFTVQASIDGIDSYERITNTATLTITINAGTPDITVTTYNGGEQTDTFNYGDTITVSGTIAASATAPGASTNAITQNQVGLYSDETELAAEIVDGDGRFTLTYDTSGKDVPIGKYQTLTVKYGGGSDLNAGSTAVTVTLNKRPVKAAFTGSTTKTYDGNANPPDGLAVALADGAVVGSDDVVLSHAGIAYNSANVHEADAITASGLSLRGPDAGWYDLSSDTATTTGSITAAPSSVTTEPTLVAGLTYTGDPQALVATGAAADGTMMYALGDDAETAPEDASFNAATPQGTGAGTYYVWYKVKGDYNHADTDPACVEVSIARKELTVSATADDKTYDGSTATSGAIALSGAVNDEQPAATGTFAFEDANAGENKQVHVTGVTLADAWGGNYTLDADSVTATAAISPRTVALVWSGYEDLTYTGSSVNVTAAVGNLVGDDQCDVTVTGGAETNAGTYTATATGLSNNNYALPTTGLTRVYMIGRAGSSVTADPTVKTLAYIGEAQELVSAGTAEGGTLQYALGADGEFSDKVPTAINAGTYTVRYYVAGDKNHTDTAAQSLTVSIAPQALAGAPVVAGNAVYGEVLAASYDAPAGAAVSWQWLRDGEEIGGATDATYTVASQDVGREISVRATATDANHAGSVTSKAVRAGARPLDVATITAQPSGSAEATGNVELTATLANAAGSDVPAGTVRFSVMSADADEGTEPEVIGSAQVERADDGALTAPVTWEQVPAGSWNVTAVYVPAESDCYATGAAATFENYDIAKAEQDALVFDMEGAKDGRLDLTFSPNATVELAVAGGSGAGAVVYALTGDDDVLALDGATVTVRHAGTATITATKAGDADYNATTATLTVTVAPAELGGTVTIAGDAVVGETLTAAYDGPAAAVAWQWLRDGKEIAGATGESYTLGADDVGCALTVRATSVDGDYAGSVESAATDKVAKAAQAAPTGLKGLAESVAGSDGGRITGLVPALAYEISHDDGETWAAPELSEDGTEAVGLAAGTYLVRLAETATHAASDTVQVTVPSFFETHGGISYPDGSTAGDDGTVTLPEEGGTVTFPGDVEIGLPGGSVVSPDKPAATLPEGGGAVTFPDGSQVVLPGGTVIDPEGPAATLPEAGGTVAFPDGTEVTLPGGSVVDGSSATAPDGTMVRPDGEGGLVVTLPDGTELAAPSGSTIGSDGSVTDPDGNPVAPEEPGDDNPPDDDEPADDEPADDEPAGNQRPSADKGNDSAVPQKDASRADGGALATTGDVAPLAALIACAAGAALLALGVIARKRKR